MSVPKGSVGPPEFSELSTVAQVASESLRYTRECRPLVQNVTNLVTMNFVANALLAAGASPVMAHAPEEVTDMVRIADALVLNIGTLDHSWIESFRAALAAARKAGRRVVLDPVGAGASAYRTDLVRELLGSGGVHVLRGNASEIRAVAGEGEGARGVDTRDPSASALLAARKLTADYGVVVCVSGEVDLIVDNSRMARLRNGDVRMTAVTGMGCVATALIGAFLGAGLPPFEAAVGAMTLVGAAGAEAASRSRGPGTLAMEFLDSLQRLDPVELGERSLGDLT